MARKKKGRPGPESVPTEQLQQMSLDPQASVSSGSGTAPSAPRVASSSSSSTESSSQASSVQRSGTSQSAPVSHAQTSGSKFSVPLLALLELVSNWFQGNLLPNLHQGSKGRRFVSWSICSSWTLDHRREL